MHRVIETRYILLDTDHPSVCPHPTVQRPCVTFYYESSGAGFNLELSRAHLPDVRQLLAALEALPPLPSESDADPFADTPRCPTCPNTTPRPGTLCDTCTDALAALDVR